MSPGGPKIDVPAWFTIIFASRYPRGLFDFVVYCAPYG